MDAKPINYLYACVWYYVFWSCERWTVLALTHEIMGMKWVASCGAAFLAVFWVVVYLTWSPITWHRRSCNCSSYLATVPNSTPNQTIIKCKTWFVIHCYALAGKQRVRLAPDSSVEKKERLHWLTFEIIFRIEYVLFVLFSHYYFALFSWFQIIWPADCLLWNRFKQEKNQMNRFVRKFMFKSSARQCRDRRVQQHWSKIQRCCIGSMPSITF